MEQPSRLPVMYVMYKYFSSILQKNKQPLNYNDEWEVTFVSSVLKDINRLYG
jgi:hypothetical protein